MSNTLSSAMLNIQQHLALVSSRDSKSLIHLELATLQTACYSAGEQPTPAAMFQELKNRIALDSAATLETALDAMFVNNDVCFFEDDQLVVMGEVLFFKFKPRAVPMPAILVVHGLDDLHCTGGSILEREETDQFLALGKATTNLNEAVANHQANLDNRNHHKQQVKYYTTQRMVSEDVLAAATAELVKAQSDVDEMDLAHSAFKRARGM